MSNIVFKANNIARDSKILYISIIYGLYIYSVKYILYKFSKKGQIKVKVPEYYY